MAKTQKITVRVPVDSLHRAQLATSEGITETVRRGLDALATAANELRRFRGKVRLDLDLSELREDRR